MEIREFLFEDWPDISRIYADGIATGVATFQTSAPDWNDWDSGHLPICRLCACKNASILGWTALSPISSRFAYRGVAEVSIYIAADARGQGVGHMLLSTMVERSECAGIWMLQSVVIRENYASIALHLSCGFRLVGSRERIAQDQNGNWRDTFILEKRKCDR